MKRTDKFNPKSLSEREVQLVLDIYNAARRKRIDHSKFIELVGDCFVEINTSENLRGWNDAIEATLKEAKNYFRPFYERIERIEALKKQPKADNPAPGEGAK